jgi:hypothetical protein
LKKHHRGLQLRGPAYHNNSWAIDSKSGGMISYTGEILAPIQQGTGVVLAEHCVPIVNEEVMIPWKYCLSMKMNRCAPILQLSERKARLQH